MDLNAQHQLTLTTAELMTLRAGLTGYLRDFAAHRGLDGGATHPEDEWLAMKKDVGQLIWRLEEAATPPGSDWTPSEVAVRPDQP